MSELSMFLKENALQVENVKYVASKRYVDPKTKKPMEWEIKVLDTDTDEKLRKDCTTTIVGKRGKRTSELDVDKYSAKMCAMCTVFPNLNSVELQDSYGVKSADALLKAMLNSGEFTEYKAKVLEVNGYDVDMEELVDEAKN